MWFKNLQIYKISHIGLSSATEIHAALCKKPLLDIKPGFPVSLGFVPPSPESDCFTAYANEGQHLIAALGTRERVLPASVVKTEVKRRVMIEEKRLGFKLGKKEIRDIKESVEFDFLPKAFISERQTRFWIDFEHDLIIIDSPSPGKAEDLISVLRDAISGLEVIPIADLVAPGLVVASWASKSKAEPPFSLTEYLEVKGAYSASSTARYKDVGPACQKMLSVVGVSSVSKIGLMWRDEIEFVLTEDMQIKRIKQHALIDQDPYNEVDQSWLSDMTIMTNQLSHMISDLTEAFGKKC